MTVHVPVRLGAAEQALIAQLGSRGADQLSERIAAAGLPTRKVEAYHYTDLKALLRTVPELAIAEKALSEPALRVPGAHRIPMTNGVADVDGIGSPGVRASVVKGSPLSERDDVLVRLNSALAEQTLRLELSGDVEQVIHIDRRTEGGPAHLNDAVALHVAAGSRATVIETFSGSAEAHLSNHASFVVVGEAAELTHIVVDLSAEMATNFATVEYDIAAEAKLRTITVHVGSALSRMQLFARFSGENADAALTGLNLVNEGQHSDITLELNHAVPYCTAKPLYKQIARGRSRAVFQGRIVVARDAQKTDAKLLMQGLMLSDDAEILSKPELEIYADDVVCGHGSTVGALDEDSLFYLLSRGIPRQEAEAMLVRGFLDEVLDPIADESLHDALEGVVERWLVGAS